MDVVKICEVVDGCEDCPKYGDDCDGDKMTENTDLISRSALMEYCSNQKSKSIDNNDIARFPSANRPSGEWLYRWNDVECSECGEFANDKTNFCPNCGADMRGGAEAVQGKWIWRTDISIGDGRTSAGYICSNCGKDYWHGNEFKYCPNCGARMKGGND